LSAREKKLKEDERRKKSKAWNVTTHTEYIIKQSDFPQYYKPQGDILTKYSKEDREKIFENNLVSFGD
jgi:citrate lyase synthetase